MTSYPYLPANCRKGNCDHAPDRCMHYRSRRCLSGECTHAGQNLVCAVNYPTPTANPSEVVR
jgi:hypothetical protein